MKKRIITDITLSFFVRTTDATVKWIFFLLTGILLFLSNNQLFAQTLSLQQSIEMAYKNNQFLKVSSLEIEGQQILVKTGRDLPRTNFDFQLGRIQAPNITDYTLGLTQQFSHPKLYQANIILQQSHVEASRRNMNIRKTEIAGLVKQAYYQLLYYNQLVQTLQQQDSLYRSALKAAETRYKTGESNLLEKVSAEVRLQEISNRLTIVDKDVEITYQQLRTLLNFQQDLKIDLQLSLKKDNKFINELSLTQNPTLSLLEQQIEIGRQQSNVERQKLKPDFRVGILNQSIEHRANQLAVIAGIGIPIFSQAQKARIEAAKVNEKITESNMRYVESQLSGQLNILKKDYEKHQNSLSYYEQFALPQANLILVNSTKSYRSGEIEYVEFIQNSQQAWQIKESYLTTILNYNQIIIQIETLLGIE